MRGRQIQDTRVIDSTKRLVETCLSSAKVYHVVAAREFQTIEVVGAFPTVVDTPTMPNVQFVNLFLIFGQARREAI